MKGLHVMVLLSDGASGEGGHPGIEEVPADLPGPGAGTPRPDLTGPGLCWLCVCLVVLCFCTGHFAMMPLNLTLSAFSEKSNFFQQFFSYYCVLILQRSFVPKVFLSSSSFTIYIYYQKQSCLYVNLDLNKYIFFRDGNEYQNDIRIFVLRYSNIFEYSFLHLSKMKLFIILNLIIRVLYYPKYSVVYNRCSYHI